MPARFVLLPALLFATALGAAACAQQPRVFGPTPAATRPAAAPSPLPTVPAPRAEPADPAVIASVRPMSPLPRPGQMPPGSYMRTIQDRGSLVAGTYQDVLLFAYLNPLNDQYEGFDIDVLREIARAIFGDPNRIEFRALTSPQRIAAVLTPEEREQLAQNTALLSATSLTPEVVRSTPAVDLVAATMTINATRRQAIEFSEVYYDAGQRVLVLKNSPYQGIHEMSGKKVCSTTGSTSERNIGTANPHVELVRMAYYTDCLVLLQQGRISGISTDDVILAGMAAQDPTTRLAGEKFTAEPYGIAMSRQRPEWAAFINGVLQEMKQDGRWKAIHDKWLSTTGPAPDPPRGFYR